MKMALQTCALRSLVPDDAMSLSRHANNERIAQYLRDRFPHPYRLSDAETFIRSATDANGNLHLAIDIDGEAVGVMGIQSRPDVHRFTAEVGYWLGEDHWGNGIATEALRAFTEYVFASTDLIRLDACVYAPNTASMRVLEKSDFQREGVLRSYVFKNGKALDAVAFAKLRTCVRGLT